MRVVRSIPSLRKAINGLKAQGQTIGFVPTMGALHEGHASLIQRCRKENDCVVLSIFVNPTQFGPHEDLKKYPRPQQADLRLARQEGVDIVFLPQAKDLYPENYLTYITVEHLSTVLCGKTRPGHFRGVTTIVAKLLHLITPDTLYLGQKDAQQAVIIQKMIQDLHFPVTPKVCPIVREPDGLAISSRNVYLTPDERSQAPVLFQSLQLACKKIIHGRERSATRVINLIQHHLTRHSRGHIDYVACVKAATLMPLKKLKGDVLIALAVKFGKTRLIDNHIVSIKSP